MISGCSNFLSTLEFRKLVNVDSSWGRRNEMSLCFGISYNGVVYLVADSRSSVINSKYIFGGIKETVLDTDSYKKIGYVEVLTYKIALLATGQNKFDEDDKTFIDVLHGINYNACSNLDAILRLTYEEFSKRKRRYMDVHLTLFIADSLSNEIYTTNLSTLQECYAHEDMRGVPISKIPEGPQQCFWQGAGWGIEVIRHSDFDEAVMDEKRIIFQINSVFDRINKLSQYFDESIGGPIRIGKLTPDGFTWLQNGYEL